MTNLKDNDEMKLKEGDKPFDFEYHDSKGNEFKIQLVRTKK